MSAGQPKSGKGIVRQGAAYSEAWMRARAYGGKASRLLHLKGRGLCEKWPGRGLGQEAGLDHDGPS